MTGIISAGDSPDRSKFPNGEDDIPRTSTLVINDNEKKDSIDVAQAPSRSDIQDYPDGGLSAWLTVVGGVCITTATFGFVNSYGLDWFCSGTYNQAFVLTNPK
ncbi:hypothetical protein Clacol_006522 [Clathrus columnatus]|uniref:Uncharacterized protein n=1 Tax=Clathrus columnatus TaxID=1419009 RepID=A0AAV5AH37_9AGAM|nr:hypothetical protein Clacol_006522 [Clathrus columnatus]